MTQPSETPSKGKPHRKWDCPCTGCQAWYRDTLAAAREEVERLVKQRDSLLIADANRHLNGCPDCPAPDLLEKLQAAHSALAEKEREGMLPSPESVRLANEFLADPDARARLKEELATTDLTLMADIIDEAVVMAREIQRLAAPSAGGEER